MVLKAVQSFGETVCLQGIRFEQIADFLTLRTLIEFGANISEGPRQGSTCRLRTQIGFEDSKGGKDNARHDGKARRATLLDGVVPGVPVQVEGAVVEIDDVDG